MREDEQHIGESAMRPDWFCM